MCVWEKRFELHHIKMNKANKFAAFIALILLCLSKFTTANIMLFIKWTIQATSFPVHPISP